MSAGFHNTMGRSCAFADGDQDVGFHLLADGICPACGEHAARPQYTHHDVESLYFTIECSACHWTPEQARGIDTTLVDGLISGGITPRVVTQRMLEQYWLLRECGYELEGVRQALRADFESCGIVLPGVFVAWFETVEQPKLNWETIAEVFGDDDAKKVQDATPVSRSLLLYIDQPSAYKLRSPAGDHAGAAHMNGGDITSSRLFQLLMLRRWTHQRDELAKVLREALAGGAECEAGLIRPDVKARQLHTPCWDILTTVLGETAAERMRRHSHRKFSRRIAVRFASRQQGIPGLPLRYAGPIAAR